MGAVRERQPAQVLTGEIGGAGRPAASVYADILNRPDCSSAWRQCWIVLASNPIGRPPPRLIGLRANRDAFEVGRAYSGADGAVAARIAASRP
jgi:hypothetical protein